MQTNINNIFPAAIQFMTVLELLYLRVGFSRGLFFFDPYGPWNSDVIHVLTEKISDLEFVLHLLSEAHVL